MLSIEFAPFAMWLDKQGIKPNDRLKSVLIKFESIESKAPTNLPIHVGEWMKQKTKFGEKMHRNQKKTTTINRWIKHRVYWAFNKSKIGKTDVYTRVNDVSVFFKIPIQFEQW